MAIKVSLRKKKIAGNRESLYLDFYPAIISNETGKPTRREFLGMYVYSPIKVIKKTTKTGVKEILVYDTNPALNEEYEKYNLDKLKIAEQIKQKKQNILDKPEIYTEFEREQLKKKEIGERSFIEYFRKLAEKRTDSNYGNWESALKYLEKYTGGNLKFSDVNEQFCNGFKEYLLTTSSNRSEGTKLSQNTAFSYFNKLKAALKQAFKDGNLKEDYNGKIEPIKQAETQRNYLTIEELNLLAKTECANPVLKKAAIFSGLTGLRFSDIAKLVWGELVFVENQGYAIHFTQQKTKGVEVLPISEQAFSMLGERKNDKEIVFEGLQYSAYQNKHLLKWLNKAGISKDITFHCFRHTYATLQLSYGTDIYTVSKMLGHRDLKTTQIYAKIIDQTKRDASNKIMLDF